MYYTCSLLHTLNVGGLKGILMTLEVGPRYLWVVYHVELVSFLQFLSIHLFMLRKAEGRGETCNFLDVQYSEIKVLRTH